MSSDENSQAIRVASRLLDFRSKIRSVLIEELGDSLDCTRVWDAWIVGTMSSNDFVPVIDRIDEIVDSVISKLEGLDA